MSEISTPPAPGEPKLRRPKPFLAALLSLPLPGLGHFYAGRPVQGLSILAISWIAFLAMYALAFVGSLNFAAFAAFALGGVLVWLVVIIAAFVAAQRVASFTPRWHGRWYGLVGIWLLSAVLSNGFYIFGVRTIQSFDAPSASMMPTILVGDRFLAVNWNWRGEGPRRGEIVVFKAFDGEGVDYVKRIVAIGGDKIEMRRGEIWLNGRPLRRDTGGSYVYRRSGNQSVVRAELFKEYSPDGLSYNVINEVGGGRAADTREFVVPPNHVFVLGDNRDNSEDSRGSVGFVPLAKIQWRPLFIFWSSAYGRIGDPVR